MRKSELPCTLASDSFYRLVEIRAFAWGRVVSGVSEQGFFLIVQERDNPVHTLYEYEDEPEYRADVERVRGFSSGDDDTGGPGVPAPVFPPLPTLSSEAAAPEQ